MRASDWDPTSDEARDYPDAVHSRLRRECPVAYSDRFGGFWALSKYDDIEEAARNPEVFSSYERFILPSPDAGGVRWKPLQSDPPEHFVYRSLLRPFFARGRVRAFEGRLRLLAVDLIEGMRGVSPVDVCPSLTLPLTGSVLCMFLGFPEKDWSLLKTWTAEQLRAANTGDRKALEAVMSTMEAYIADLMAERRARPADPAEDLMSALLAAHIDGTKLEPADIEGMFKLLMGAGHETTANGLGNMLRLMAEHEDQQEFLRADPARIPAAVEEALRFWGPVGGLVRTTTCPVNVRGTVIPQGEVVALLWASAGRDEDHNENPDECIFGRAEGRHLAFGAGPHRCVGADLARAQMRVAVEELLSRTRWFRLAAPPRRRGWPSIGTSELTLDIDWSTSPVGSPPHGSAAYA